MELMILLLFFYFKHKEYKHFIKIQLHSAGYSEHLSRTQED